MKTTNRIGQWPRLFAGGLWLGAGLLARAITPAPPAEPAEEPAENDGAAAPPAASVAPAPEAHPYTVIISRNAFGLKEPPPPTPPPQKPPEPPVNTSALKLTGITTLLGKRAMFVFNDGKTNIVSDLVREGERDRFITNLEVLEIDASARTVKVLFGGQEMRLDFVNHGLRPPTNIVATPPGVQLAAGRPGAPPMPTLPPSTPVTQPLPSPTIQAGNTAFTSSPPNPSGAVRNLPIRPNRLGGSLGAGNPNPQAGDAPPEVPIEQQIRIIQEQHRLARELNIELPPPPPAPGLENLSGPPALPDQLQRVPNVAPPALPGTGPPPLPGQH
jgi:hypothetical protein